MLCPMSRMAPSDIISCICESKIPNVIITVVNYCNNFISWSDENVLKDIKTIFMAI